MELFIIIVLILLNGVFSMSETAVISSRKARLQQLAEKGDKGAQTALGLANEPNRFLSTVQVGITLIGVLTGAFGGATIAESIAGLFRETPLAPYAQGLSFGLVVVLVTYFSLILGELVPKRLALQNPEGIASAIARPMTILARATSPLISFLSGSTDAVLLLLGIRPSNEPSVSEEEIKTMVQQGTQEGIFEEHEQDMISGIFRLGERRVGALMTPRHEVYWLDIQDSEEENRAKIRNSIYSWLPVCDGDMDHVVGVLSAKKLLSRLLAGDSFDIAAVMSDAQFVPETMSATKVLELFRETAQHIAIVIGEYGGMEGLITMQDLLVEIVGEVDESEPEYSRRDDGSWLIDGLILIDDFKDLFLLDNVPGEHDIFTTLGGFVMAQMGKIPQSGESFDWGKLHFEVIDMDGNRVDKVMVTEKPPEVAAEASTGEDAGAAAGAAQAKEDSPGET